MISHLDALTLTAKKLPPEGVTYREFVTRAIRLRCDSDYVLEQVIKEWVDNGRSENDIIRPGPAIAALGGSVTHAAICGRITPGAVL